MKRTILFANEYNTGNGNVLPLYRLATHPNIKALGDIHLVLSKEPDSYLGIDCDIIEAPKKGSTAEKCFADTLRNTAFSLDSETFISLVQKRIDYLESNLITHVVLRDSPLMAIAAYALGLERIFYQNSISIPPSARWKRSITSDMVDISSDDTILSRVNYVLDHLGKEPVADLSYIFKSDNNICSEYPLFDIYKYYNSPVSRSDVQYVGLLSGEGYHKKPDNTLRTVLYLNKPNDYIHSLIKILKDNPKPCEVIVFNTSQNKIEQWSEDGVVFVGDVYQPVEPYLIGADLFITDSGSTLLLKAISCGCLPLLIDADNSHYVKVLSKAGAVFKGADALSAGKCFNDAIRKKYIKALRPITNIEMRTINDPVTAIINAVENKP